MSATLACIREVLGRLAAQRCTRLPSLQSVLRKSREIALGLSVPPHPGERMLPPALHLVERCSVCLITARDDLVQMTVLRLDHLVGSVAMVRCVTRPTEFSTGHRLHEPRS